jgi:hypothetical protein
VAGPEAGKRGLLRPLPPRPSGGGTDGQLSPEATAAKRAEIAAGIRAHAATLEGRAQMMRYFESLAYEVNEEALQSAGTIAAAETVAIQALDADGLEKNKNQILEFERALNYLARYNAIPQDHTTRVTINALVETQGWHKK